MAVGCSIYQQVRWLSKLKAFLVSRWFHPLLLLLWLVIGTGLRFTQLAAKPAWTDEFSTIVFSLGNSFRVVPLDRAIALDVLLQPLLPNPNAGIADVVKHLLTESNHPPLYFVLAHEWMQLFSPNPSGYASVWAARALPALFGAVSIPAIYGLGWLAFRSRLIGQIAAAMMAVSPYGIFLAQEARHYTLAVLWVIASLSCLVIATRQIHQQTPLPTWVVTAWVSINFLAISTHYFFCLTLCAEALWLIVLAWRQKTGSGQHWWQIYVVAFGTLIGCLVWLPVFWQESSGGELIDWIQSGTPGLLAWLSPVFQALAGWVGMLCLLPLEAASLYLVIASGLVMLWFFCWAVPILRRGIIIQLKQPKNRLMTQLFAVVIVGAIALIFFFTYALGIDLTRGPRYNFVYFPAVSVLLAASLAVCWNTPTKSTSNSGLALLPWLRQDSKKHYSLTGRKAVALIWLMGLLSGLTVVGNLGYHKYYRPELLVPLIEQVSQSPVLIATTHKTHVQTGEMIGLAREFKSGSQMNPLFLLADQAKSNSTIVLQHTLTQLARPLDLWLVNFHAPVVGLNGCRIADSQSVLPQPGKQSYTRIGGAFPHVDGYEYHLYHCK